jgi:hypothetical protein
MGDREKGDWRRENGNRRTEKRGYENTIGKTSVNLLKGLNLSSHGWNPWKGMLARMPSANECSKKAYAHFGQKEVIKAWEREYYNMLTENGERKTEKGD